MDIDKHIKLLLNGKHGNPFEVLGMHIFENKVCIRAFLP